MTKPIKPSDLLEKSDIPDAVRELDYKQGPVKGERLVLVETMSTEPLERATRAMLESAGVVIEHPPRDPGKCSLCGGDRYKLPGYDLPSGAYGNCQNHACPDPGHDARMERP